LLNGEALDTLSLSRLEGAVRQANRLMANFKSDNPRPVRARTLRITEAVRPWTKIFCIPGANLVVAYDCMLGSLNCWDILTSHRVPGHLKIPGLRVQTESVCMEIKGKALVGAWIGYVAWWQLHSD
jgi:hypothetical protein